MRVLVTGSSGRIGAAVAKMIAESHDVLGLDIAAGPNTTCVGSITDAKLVDSLVSSVEAVIHTAALHAPHVGVMSDAAFQETNVGGTACLLEASRKHAIRRFVYTSSTSVYGAAMVVPDRAVWVTEELQPVARDIYDETKLAGEELCRDATAAGLPCISLRMSRCFPEPDNLMAVYRLYRGVDIRDVARAHAHALESAIDSFEIFNVSAAPAFRRDECTQLSDAADEVITRHFPWAARAFSARRWQLPTRIDRVYVVEKAERLLGFRPEYNFDALFDSREKG